jgi:hypothetical protein
MFDKHHHPSMTVLYPRMYSRGYVAAAMPGPRNVVSVKQHLCCAVSYGAKQSISNISYASQ